MQAFHHGVGVRFYRFGISSINSPPPSHPLVSGGLQSIAMRARKASLLDSTPSSYLSSRRKPELISLNFNQSRAARIFRDSAATQSAIDCPPSLWTDLIAIASATVRFQPKRQPNLSTYEVWQLLLWLSLSLALANLCVNSGRFEGFSNWKEKGAGPTAIEYTYMWN